MPGRNLPYAAIVCDTESVPPYQRSRHLLQSLQILVALRAPTLLAAWLVRHASPNAPREIRSILVVRMDGIGDAALTLPLIERLHLCLPKARLTVLTRDELADVFRMSPAVDEVLALPRIQHRARLQLIAAAFAALHFAWRHLRGRSFDAALCPRWDVDVTMATLLALLSRAPIRIGYEDAASAERLRLNRGFHRAFTHVLPAGPLQHEALRAAALAVPLGCSGEVAPPRIIPSDAPPEAIRELRSFHPAMPLLVIALPAGSPHRRWPASHWIATLHALRVDSPVAVALIADSATEETAAAIVAALPDVVRLPAISLPQVAATLATCHVFLGGDSGIGHIAAAVGCSIVTLSPHPQNADPAHTNSPKRFSPFTPLAIVLQPALARPGCENGCNATEPHCILDITPLQASVAIMTLLTTRHTQPRRPSLHTS